MNLNSVLHSYSFGNKAQNEVGTYSGHVVVVAVDNWIESFCASM